MKGGGETLRIEHSVIINRPIEEVFAFMADIGKMPLWAAELQGDGLSESVKTCLSLAPNMVVVVRSSLVNAFLGYFGHHLFQDAIVVEPQGVNRQRWLDGAMAVTSNTP